jgi:hypothetical protein
VGESMLEETRREISLTNIFEQFSQRDEVV